MPDEKKFIVCPSCGSTDMRRLSGGNTGDQCRCGKCGYEGIALKGNVKFIRDIKKMEK
jgi:Zn ribbon nucleic-acid-binding protein